jgi:hypothetical protein
MACRTTGAMWRISLPGYLLRALVGRDVRGEVGLYPARRVLRDPP